MILKDYFAGQIVKFNIWRTMNNVFRSTDPQVVAFREKLFPNGKPTTDEFVMTLAQHVKSGME